MNQEEHLSMARELMKPADQESGDEDNDMIAAEFLRGALAQCLIAVAQNDGLPHDSHRAFHRIAQHLDAALGGNRALTLRLGRKTAFPLPPRWPTGRGTANPQAGHRGGHRGTPQDAVSKYPGRQAIKNDNTMNRAAGTPEPQPILKNPSQ